ncbi:MAG: transposase [Coprococcus comes]
MFRKSKIEPVEKVKIVERYLAGEIGIQQAGKELGVDHHSIRNWISIYQYDGPTGLLNQPKNKSYSKDLKISAINDYLNGEGSLQDICTKYGIRSHRQLSDWIKVYNSGGILKTSTGGAYMKKAKNTTLDERLKIVTDKISPAIAWLTIQKFIIFYCPLDGEHTRNDLKSMVPF